MLRRIMRMPQCRRSYAVNIYGRTSPLRGFVRWGHKQVRADGSVVEVGLEHWQNKSPRSAPLAPLEAVSPTEGKSNKGATMLKYIAHMQEVHGDAVVLTQVGSFMELYFDQAIEYAAKLHIKLARKNQRNPLTGEPSVPMAGFPLARLEYYEKILVQDLGKTVVVLAQDAEHVVAGGREKDKRPVERILTKGTLLAESFVAEDISNYLLAVHVTNAKSIALVWVDLADGVVRYTVATLEELANELARVNPSEIIVNSDSDEELATIQRHAPRAAISCFRFPPSDWWAAHKSSLQRYNLDVLPQTARKAFTGLAAYIEKCMPGSSIELEPPILCRSRDFMQLDINARNALDMLARTGIQGRPAEEGSLLSVIRRTRTASGSRLLQEWLMSPLVAPDAILARQDKVQFFIDQPMAVTSILRTFLGEMPDGPRMLQKLSLRRLDPLDLVTTANSVVTLQKLSDFAKSIETTSTNTSAALLPKMDDLLRSALRTAKATLKAINTDEVTGKNGADSEGDGASERQSYALASKSQRALPLASLLKLTSDYKPVLHSKVSERLERLYERLETFQDRYDAISNLIVEQFGPNATLRWHKQHKFCVHVKTPNSVLDDIRAERTPGRVITENKGAAYVENAEWRMLGLECSHFNEELRAEEMRILEKFREKFVHSHTTALRKAYALVDELDVYLSLATLATEKHLVRPTVVEDSTVFDIRQGRHVTVEAGMAVGGHATQDFIANDCVLTAKQPVAMITGPNMGGKSTYIRQAAIITLLAHMGSYVPCESAVIGVVDRIFCRVGAGDDLYRGRSTFMLEMLETATILNYATSRSLAILDEVGRGTSVKESEAIAFATIKHLAHSKTCRTLFATHYGAEIWRHLSSVQGMGAADAIQCLQSSAAVVNNELEFDYELRPGISESSCGLLVAQMAGFPPSALRDAENIASAQMYG